MIEYSFIGLITKLCWKSIQIAINCESFRSLRNYKHKFTNKVSLGSHISFIAKVWILSPLLSFKDNYELPFVGKLHKSGVWVKVHTLIQYLYGC